MADGPSGRDRSVSFHVVRYDFLTVVWLVPVLMGVRMLALGSALRLIIA